MTNLGQMLAVAQAYSTPEQQRRIAQTEGQQKEFEVAKEKKSQMDELQALMEAEMKRASEKGGVFKKLGDLGKILSFIPGVGTGWSAGLGAISGAGQAAAQKIALNKLRKDSRFAKYKGTWLDDPTKAFMKDVKGTAGDINPLTTGLTSYATSKLTGDLAGKIGGKFKGMFKGPSQITEQGLADNPWLTQADEFGDIEWTGDISTALDKEGPFKNLMANIERGGGIGGGGLRDLFKDFDLMEMVGKSGRGLDNIAALPVLLQLFGGNNSSDYGAGQYFGKGY
jgi:hypothetical protein